MSAVIKLDEYENTHQYILEGLNATSRNRYRYSCKTGYLSKRLTVDERNNLLQAIHEINVSAPQRQGREMSPSYKIFPSKVSNTHTCEEHYTDFYGCFTREGKLIAYATIQISGKNAFVSQILGHKAYLNDGVMLNLWVEIVTMVAGSSQCQTLVYYHWNCASKGLQDWKKAVGCKPILLNLI